MERMELDMERDRHMMKIRHKNAHRRLLKKQKKKTRGAALLASHPYLSPADDYTNSFQRGRKKMKKRVQYDDEVEDTSDLIASTLREAEQWRTTIAEQELQENHAQHTSPLSEDEHLGSTLLGYERNRMARLAPRLDSVLGYEFSEEPQ
jgi:hypothetical protein